MLWTVHLEGGPRRVNHAAVRLGDDVYSFGGYCSNEQPDGAAPIDIHRLNTETYRWSRVYTVNESRPPSKNTEDFHAIARLGLAIAAANDEDIDSVYQDAEDDDGDESVSEDDTASIEEDDESHDGAADDDDESEEEDDDMDIEEEDEDEALKHKKESPVPYQRYGHTVVAHGNCAYLWGGRNDEFGASSQLHCFDPATLRWSVVQTMGHVPPARDGHSAFVYNGKMYLFGGFEEELQRFSQETYCYDFEQRTWTELQTRGDKPQWRDFHTAVVLAGVMYVFGGRSDATGQFHSSRDEYDTQLRALDLNTLTWSTVDAKGDRPCGRRSHSAWTYCGRMFIFGGFFGIENKHFNDLHSFDPATQRWTRHMVRGQSPCVRRRQCTVEVNGRVFLFGGTMPVSARDALARPYDSAWAEPSPAQLRQRPNEGAAAQQQQPLQAVQADPVAGQQQQAANNAQAQAMPGLCDLSDLFVLDYCPSLLDMTARLVIDYQLARRYEYAIPRDLLCVLENMTKPNVIGSAPVNMRMANG